MIRSCLFESESAMTHSHDHSHRRYAGLTIDTHAHWYPPEFLELLGKDGPANNGGVERNALRHDGWNDSCR